MQDYVPEMQVPTKSGGHRHTSTTTSLSLRTLPLPNWSTTDYTFVLLFAHSTLPVSNRIFYDARTRLLAVLPTAFDSACKSPPRGHRERRRRRLNRHRQTTAVKAHSFVGMADRSGSSPRQHDRTINVSAQLQSLRDLLNSERRNGFDHQRAYEALDEEISARSNTLENERHDTDAYARSRETPPISETVPSSNSPDSLVRLRRRAIRPSERFQRHRERYHQQNRSETAESAGNPRRVTPPPPFTESVMDEYVTDPQVGREPRYRAKRRKLDDGTFEDETRTVAYGDEGRVTPGPLQMEIIQCDGGEYFQPPTGMAQHVLQDDRKVYSTKENRCNMLLKHAGGMPFSLTKVVIKAPDDGYDSPLQEGMIFVALNDDKLMEKTSQYDKYSPRSYRYHLPRRYDHWRPSQEYRQYSDYQPPSDYRPPRDSRPSQDWINPYGPPGLRSERTRYSREPYTPWSPHAENDPELENTLVPGFEVSFASPSDAEDSPSFTPRSPVPWRDLDAAYSLRSYNGRVRNNLDGNENQDDDSATSSESEDDYVPPYRDRTSDVHDLDEGLLQRSRLLTRVRMAHERGGDYPLALEEARRDVHQVLHDLRTRTEPPRRLVPSSRLARRLGLTAQGNPSVGIGTSPKTIGDPSTLPSVPASDVIAPHARFAMKETQKSISINFDPPVAGRYILIKLWASRPASNIDIQCIVPHGYGGPRFFPSVEAR